MIGMLSVLGGAAAAKLLNGQERRRHGKESQLIAEVQGSQQALSQERTKRSRAERKLAKLQQDNGQALRQLQELQQEKELLRQQLEAFQQQQRPPLPPPRGKASPEEGKKDTGCSNGERAMLYKRLNVFSKENKKLRRQNAALNKERLHLQTHKQRMEEKAAQLLESTAQLHRSHAELQQKMELLRLEQLKVQEQAQQNLKLESQLQALKSEVSGVFNLLVTKQLTEQEAVDQIRALGCEVSLVEAAQEGERHGHESGKLVVNPLGHSIDSAGSDDAQVDITPFQMAFVLDAPDKLRRLMSSHLSRTSSHVSPAENNLRASSIFSSQTLSRLETKVTGALDTPPLSLHRGNVEPFVGAPYTPVHPTAAQLGGRDKAGVTPFIGEKPERTCSQQDKGFLHTSWSLKAAGLSFSSLPKFLSSKTLGRGTSGTYNDGAELTLPACLSTGNELHSSSSQHLALTAKH